VPAVSVVSVESVESVERVVTVERVVSVVLAERVAWRGGEVQAARVGHLASVAPSSQALEEAARPGSGSPETGARVAAGDSRLALKTIRGPVIRG